MIHPLAKTLAVCFSAVKAFKVLLKLSDLTRGWTMSPINTAIAMSAKPWLEIEMQATDNRD